MPPGESGRRVESCIKKMMSGRECTVITFGEDSDEYVIMDLETGRCQLFENGVLQMSWTERDDNDVNRFTLYHNGVVIDML